MNIVLLDAATLGEVAALSKIKELGNLTVYDTTLPSQTIERVKGNSVVITNKVIIDKSIMDACPELKLICITATGLNNVNLDYAKEKGIEVKNVAGYSTDSVAQTTFALLLSLLMKINYFNGYVKSGSYSKSPVFTHHGESFAEIKGKRLGIVGLGSIGRKVAHIASVFGAEVVYTSTSGVKRDEKYEEVSFEELIATSDFISIHCPLNERTNNLFTLSVFEKMKNSAIIINTGRGKIINEADLATALNKELISGAGLDVLEYEPIKADNPLLKINEPDKIIITPHIAWISREAREILINSVVNNIVEWKNI